MIRLMGLNYKKDDLLHTKMKIIRAFSLIRLDRLIACPLYTQQLTNTRVHAETYKYTHNSTNMRMKTQERTLLVKKNAHPYAVYSLLLPVHNHSDKKIGKKNTTKSYKDIHKK